MAGRRYEEFWHEDQPTGSLILSLVHAVERTPDGVLAHTLLDR